MAHLDRDGPDLEALAVGELDIWAGRTTERESYPETLLRQLVVEPAIRRMEVDRGGSRSPDCGYAKDVIEVSVGEPDGANAPAVPDRRSEELVCLLARVDQDGIGRFGVEYQVAVLRELAIGNRNDVEAECRQAASTATRALRSVRYFSTAIAAVVASPTAVVTCRVS
jgi:hypothetical protein